MTFNILIYHLFLVEIIIFSFCGTRLKVENRIKYEPAHDKTNKMACAPSKDSVQPGNLPSLIRAFAVRMKKAWVLSYLLSTQPRLIRLSGCPGLSESLLGAHSILLVLSCAGSYDKGNNNEKNGSFESKKHTTENKNCKLVLLCLIMKRDVTCNAAQTSKHQLEQYSVFKL